MFSRVANFTVHGIGPPSRELEPGEERTWVTVDQFEDLLDAVVGRPDARLTFDDANASDLEVALPRLLERDLRAEFFVLAGRLGETGRLEESGVRELAAAGMTIGSHGWAHRHWRGLDPGERRQEIEIAPKVLAEMVGRPIRRVAIPFGSYDRRVLAWLRHARVERVYTSDGGRCGPGEWLQARTSVGPHTSPDWLANVLDGSPGPVQWARRVVARQVKRWRGGGSVAASVGAVVGVAPHASDLTGWPA